MEDDATANEDDGDNREREREKRREEMEGSEWRISSVVGVCVCVKTESKRGEW